MVSTLVIVAVGALVFGVFCKVFPTDNGWD
jgi:hypothetical protein